MQQASDRREVRFAGVPLGKARHICALFHDLDDLDSTPGADVDDAKLLPSLFELKAGTFYIALAGERDHPDGVQWLPCT
jgi:hypothetical protein